MRFPILMTALLAGCALTQDGEDVIDVPPAPEATPTLARLAEGQDFELDAEASAVSFTARLAVRDGDGVAVSLDLLGGRFHARAAGRDAIVVDALAIDLADVVVTDERLPPGGVRLTGMTVSLVGPAVAAAEWTADDEQATAAGPADFALDWALVDATGRVLPLPSQRVPGIAMTFGIDADAAHLAASADLLEWPAGGLIEVTALHLELSAQALPN